jgi:anaerobic selenocysteine-containing dehydrogenase
MQTADSTSRTEKQEKILKGICHSCHGGCSVLLHVKGNELLRVDGDPEGPLNRGRLCPIGSAVRDIVYHPDRLKYPQRRIGPRGSGKWERITWDEALDTIASRLHAIRNEFGPESVAVGTGTGRHLIIWMPRLAYALGTPNWMEPGFAQCFFPRVNAGFMTFGDFPVRDCFGDTQPECMLFWGANPTVSGPAGEPKFTVHKALKNNPKIIVVDPRETRMARMADVWLRIRPGADDALALAMLNVIIGEDLIDRPFVEKWTHGFEALAEHVAKYTPEWAEPVTWVPADKIREAARLFARTKPAMLNWGCALEHTPKCFQTIRALTLLPAITGNIDVPGGWVFGMEALAPFPTLMETVPKETLEKRLGAARFKVLANEHGLPGAHIPSVLKAMREGEPYPVKAFLLFGNNALTTYANTKQVYESLVQLDFMVATDVFMTPTAELADIVLPAACWPEVNMVLGYPSIANTGVSLLQKSIQIGECKSDQEIVTELVRRMGLEHGTESVEEVLDYQLKNGPLDITFEDLKKKGFVTLPMRYRKYEERGFKTPTGKVELYSTILEQMGYAPLPAYEEAPESPYSAPGLARKYPLVLTTGHRNPFFFNSEHRQIKRLRKGRPDPIAEIHPKTAADHGIADGQWMWIENQRGRVRMCARYSPGLDPRVISAEHAWWFPEAPAPEYGVWQSNINVLTSNEPPYDPAMGTYQLRALLCRVSKVDPADMA